MEITQDIARELLHYDPETGIFTWLTKDRCCFKTDASYKTWHTVHSGKRAGCSHEKKKGYVVRVIGISGKLYTEHSLAFLYMTGEIPEVIDHIDGNASNNKWKNLRISGFKDNSRNCSMNKLNTSGVSGVTWDKSRDKWHAKIMVSGKTINLGRYEDLEDAKIAVANERAKHGFSKRHGVSKRVDEFCSQRETN